LEELKGDHEEGDHKAHGKSKHHEGERFGLLGKLSSGVKSVGNKMRHPLGGKKEETEDWEGEWEQKEHDDEELEEGKKGDKPAPKEEGEEPEEEEERPAKAEKGEEGEKPPMNPEEVEERFRKRKSSSRFHKKGKKAA